MQFRFHNKKITSILGILPEYESCFDDELNNYAFPEKQTMRIKKIMGFNKHRLAKESSCVSDFGVYGLEYMLTNKWLIKEDIGALIVVTSTPDHFIPHVSNIIHGQLELAKDIFCLDIAQGCCGFVLGLIQSFMLLEYMKYKKVVLINGDVLSHRVSKQDRSEYPLSGDAVTITVIENYTNNDEIYCDMNFDGTRSDAIKIPAGGFRIPGTPDTQIIHEAEDGNFRSLENLRMNGNEVFNFILSEVPEILEHAFKETGKNMNDMDYFLFHQPNKFILSKLAQAINVPEEKMPMNLVENYGNSSGASIPMIIAMNLKDKLLNSQLNCCLSAFGSGLAWGVILMQLGKFEHCELIESEL